MFTKLFSKNNLSSISSLSLLCCLSTVLQSNDLQELRSSSVSSIQGHTSSETQLLALKNSPSLGFQNLIADWSFVQFLQYFGDDEARKQTGYNDSAKYLAVAIHHDPYLRDFYVFLSGSSTIFAGNPEETIQVMSEGLNQLRVHRAPDSYYIWRYKGTDELLFLSDGKAAQRSFEMAANWALQSVDKEASIAAKVSQQTAKFLAENPDSHLAQINAWGSILTTALDNQTRNRAIEKIRELGGDVMMTEDGQIQITYSRAEASSDNHDI
jgi:hypothetical protein